MQNIPGLIAYTNTLKFDDNDVIGHEPVRQLPEKKLLAATIMRALKDLTAGERHIERGARAWIYNKKSKKKFSFIWCCIYLDFDYTWFQNKPLEELLTISNNLKGL